MIDQEKLETNLLNAIILQHFFGHLSGIASHVSIVMFTGYILFNCFQQTFHTSKSSDFSKTMSKGGFIYQGIQLSWKPISPFTLPFMKNNSNYKSYYMTDLIEAHSELIQIIPPPTYIMFGQDTFLPEVLQQSLFLIWILFYDLQIQSGTELNLMKMKILFWGGYFSIVQSFLISGGRYDSQYNDLAYICRGVNGIKSSGSYTFTDSKPSTS